MKYQLLSLTALAAFTGVTSAIKYGNVRIVKIAPEFRTAESPRSTRVLVKFGPYGVPAYDENATEDSIYEVHWHKNVTKPCSDCVLKYVSASLVNRDGSRATADTGAYMEGLTLSVEGQGKVDVVCPDYSLGQRILYTKGSSNSSSGRSVLFSKAASTGYYLSKEDKMSMILEMQNEADDPKEVFLHLTFEYHPGKPANLIPAPERTIRFPCQQ
ncbi:hypothetical protein BT63DRAFT_413617 [Microthyrium microscopicum]|uniref:Uncharacterized protein n=1 Tax=Microthyrium microscopicum TaxID=703497 RepID=A0A6A6UC04_9PEZI|nr:hypothetical protein BT63DRAFT_413617 [Microthyrium microscopicum]